MITSNKVNIEESRSRDPNIKSGDLTQLKDRINNLGTVQGPSNEAKENGLEQNAEDDVNKKGGMNSSDNLDQASLEESNQSEFQSFDLASQTSNNETIDEEQGSANFTTSDEEANGEECISKIAPRNTKCKARSASESEF